jgi:UDP-2,4-diacetamido-2,4,6-trideoxy-beta-L-altropyranose hydrolase
LCSLAIEQAQAPPRPLLDVRAIAFRILTRLKTGSGLSGFLGQCTDPSIDVQLFLLFLGFMKDEGRESRATHYLCCICCSSEIFSHSKIHRFLSRSKAKVWTHHGGSYMASIICFRVDASQEIGTGHVVRCKTLATSLRRLGLECCFVCRDLEGNMIESIKSDGFKVTTLVSGPTSNSAVNSQKIAKKFAVAHEAWLETDWEKDAEQTIKAIQGVALECLIVDHYALDARWESRMRPHAKRIMAIDDLADRRHDCDILLDQNLVFDMDQRYKFLVPPHCVTLLGPRFALLQPEYARFRLRSPPRSGPIRRVLASFGGVDQHNATGMVISAFLNLCRSDIHLDVVLPEKSPHSGAIRAQVQGQANITLHESISSLATLVMRADLALGACGATSWERCCLGLPALAITIADNQKHIAAELDRQGVVQWLGHYDAVTVSTLTLALQQTVAAPDIEVWSRRCMMVLDGDGCTRVAALLALDGTSLKARPAMLSDEAVLIQWLVEMAGQDCDKSTEAAHKARFYDSMRQPEGRSLFMVEAKDHMPVGFVSFERTTQGWDVTVHVAHVARGRDLSKPALEKALLEFRHTMSGSIALGQIRSNEKLSKDGHAPSTALAIAVCSDRGSWFNWYIPKLLIAWSTAGHRCCWAHDANLLPGGDVCYYLSYGRIVKQQCLDKYGNNLVVHESDLHKGKGWSPLTWLILEGCDRVPVTLIEAVGSVDSGPIYAQKWIQFQGCELVEELRARQATCTQDLCTWFVDNYPKAARQGVAQTAPESFYPRRRPEDSRLDVNSSLTDQFNQLRVADNDRYPAFFEIHGKKFKIAIHPHN